MFYASRVLISHVSALDRAFDALRHCFSNQLLHGLQIKALDSYNSCFNGSNACYTAISEVKWHSRRGFSSAIGGPTPPHTPSLRATITQPLPSCFPRHHGAEGAEEQGGQGDRCGQQQQGQEEGEHHGLRSRTSMVIGGAMEGPRRAAVLAATAHGGRSWNRSGSGKRGDIAR